MTESQSNYEDVTDEMDQFSRGLLVSSPQNCPYGLMVGGKYDGFIWARRFGSETMQIQKDKENIYYRTGEIFSKEDAYYVVFRPMDQPKKTFTNPTGFTDEQWGELQRLSQEYSLTWMRINALREKAKKKSWWTRLKNLFN